MGYYFVLEVEVNKRIFSSATVSIAFVVASINWRTSGGEAGLGLASVLVVVLVVVVLLLGRLGMKAFLIACNAAARRSVRVEGVK